jgi:hypothetical protein
MDTHNKTMMAPFFVLIGIITNTLNLIIFNSKTFKSRPVALYFLILAMVDILCVIQYCQYFIYEYFQLDLKSYSRFSCITLMYCLYFLPGVSVWLEILISIDRMLNLTKPQQYPYLRKHSFQLGAFFTIVCTNFATYSPFVFKYDLNKDRNSTQEFGILEFSRTCKLRDENVKFSLALIDMLNFTLLPIPIMLICSILMIRKLFRIRNRLSVNETNFMSASSRRDLRNKKFAIKSLILNVIYFIFNIPITATNFALVFSSSQLTQMIFLVSLNFFFIKFCLPFFVYFSVNKTFRSEFFKLFGCSR